jgi:hypothetical protein
MDEITLSKDEYERMLSEIDFLECLRACGVDNWNGYDYAVEMFNDENPD